MAADIFFADGMAFLITMSRRIKFVTAENMPVRMAASLSKHLNQVIQVYQQARFLVRTVLMDGEFKKIKDLIPQLECNTTVAKEHVSEAERMIRTIKERTRGLIGMLTFDNIPRQMKIEFIYFVILWLNAFPAKNGISAVYSPQELLVQWRLDYAKHCWVLPRTYCEVHDEPLPSNTMVTRTHEAIATGPTGNLQGRVKFYCLNTGRILKRQSFMPLPMPDCIIKHINQIGGKEKQGRTFWFLNRKKQPYKWTDEVPKDDPEFQGLLEDKVKMAAYPDISAKMPGVKLEEEEHNFQVVTDNPEPDFAALATAALDNAGIGSHDRLCTFQQLQQQANPAPPTGPAMIEADGDKIVYEITFDLPDARLGTGMVVCLMIQTQRLR
jgi:hypothetical protein